MTPFNFHGPRTRLLRPTILAAAIGLALALPCAEAQAGWSVNTRPKCRWWAKQYVAKAHSGCGILLLCAQSSSSCGTAAANCVKYCSIGKAEGHSWNGPSGWGGWSSATGIGFAGLHGAEGATEASASQNRIEGTVAFDEALGAVVVTVLDGELEAAADGSFSEIEIVVWRSYEGDPESVEDAVPADRVLWQGAARVEAGEVRYAGELSAQDIAPVPTDRTASGATRVIASGIEKVIPVESPADLEDLVVTIRCDSGFGSRVVPTYAQFVRGDSNGDGGVDLADAIGGLNYLFRGASAPPCMDAANTNGVGGFDLSDPIFTLSWFFLGGPEPPAPGPFQCGPNPGGRSLGCKEYSACKTTP
ncbi:MAG: hypothetical protein HY721_31530 [Planctomycetes bacterium]|nr:hypothetical protein [Planctomycetota bacterium]